MPKKTTTITMATELFEEFRAIGLTCGLDSDKENLNSAMTLFAHAVAEIQKGNWPATIDGRTGAINYINMPAFEIAANGGSANSNQSSPKPASPFKVIEGGASEPKP